MKFLCSLSSWVQEIFVPGNSTVFLFEVCVFFVQAESSGSGEQQVKPYSFILISLICNVNIFTMDSIPSAGLR